VRVISQHEFEYAFALGQLEGRLLDLPADLGERLKPETKVAVLEEHVALPPAPEGVPENVFRLGLLYAVVERLGL
jgi:hypothetical protein